MLEKQYRREGRYITAIDVAERLLPDLNINEVMLWSPDLFAYTSYILTMNSAYQLVVSPPSKKKWQPEKAGIIEWLCKNAEENIQHWYDKIKVKWSGSENFDFSEHYHAIEIWKNRIRTDEEKYDKSDNGRGRKIGEWEYLEPSESSGEINLI